MSLAAISRTDRNISTSLRHSRAHRAKIKAAAANRETVVFAEFNASAMDEEGSPRDAALQIHRWAEAGSRSARTIYSESSVDPWSMSVRFVTVIAMKGLVTLPVVAGQWKISKATPEQEAWARKKAR